jgi:hypothetical protein
MQILRQTSLCGISFATQLHPQTTPANTRPRIYSNMAVVLVWPLKFSGWPFVRFSVKLCSAQLAELLCRSAAQEELNSFRRSGHYMYRPEVTIYTANCRCMFIPVVTIYTALWSPYVQSFGHYIYSPVVTIRTAQWSLYVQPSGYYMYSPVQPSGHYMYRQFNIQQFYVLPTQCIYVFCVDLRTNSDYFPIQH